MIPGPMGRRGPDALSPYSLWHALQIKEDGMNKPWLAILCLLGMVLLRTGLLRAQQPIYGGALRIALGGDMTSFNANQGPAPGHYTFWVWNNIFNSLLTLTPPPDLKVVPELAKSWEVLDEGRTYLFSLERGVTFHDGTDFDAQAAKWNFDRILDPEVGSWVRPYYEEIERVEVVDKYTLRVRMKEPSGALPLVLAGYFQGVPMASPQSFATHGEAWVRHPTGTGPYKFKEWLPGEHVILEKNPHYFKKGFPYLDTLEFRVMRDPHTASAALRVGAVDFIARVPMQQAYQLEKVPDVHLVTGQEMAPIVALLNMRVPPFDDLRARRAIGGYGIDRQKIARLALDGRVSPLVSILPVGVPGAIDLNTLYPYDPEKARGLLKELGFHAQNPLKVTMLVPNHEMVLVDVAALLADQLAKISVQTKIVLVDAVAWVDRVIAGHDFEMVVSNWSSLLDINMRSVSFFKGGASNYTGIDDSRLEAMTRQWRRSLSADERERLSADMQRLIADQLYWINVTGYPFFQAYHSYVHDYPFFNQTYMFLERVWIEP